MTRVEYFTDQTPDSAITPAISTFVITQLAQNKTSLRSAGTRLPSGSATRQALNCRQPRLPGCCRAYVERPAFGCHVY